jgi:hypothetical protein
MVRLLGIGIFICFGCFCLCTSYVILKDAYLQRYISPLSGAAYQTVFSVVCAASGVLCLYMAARAIRSGKHVSLEA